MEEVVPARRRVRATTACIACRRSRIRCIVEQGERKCSPCKSGEIECLFEPHRDGRKNRKNSKALAEKLAQQVEQLQTLLKQQSQTASITGNQSAKSSPRVLESVAGENFHPVIDAEAAESIASQHDDFADERAEVSALDETNAMDTSNNPQEDANKDIIGTIMSSPVRFDMAAGRIRFFGQTTSMQVLSSANQTRVDIFESHWPIVALIRDLRPETHDYLMDQYWSCHNSVIHLVHKDAFQQDQENGASQFYSIFLHICMLAIGFRYGDKSRKDIRRLDPTGKGTSTLHEKAKGFARLELEKPGGIPSIQALFLLGDLECAIGRNDTGWMFAGMAFRLAIDVGLHVDVSELRLTEKESQMRHMVLWACMINDKYWSLYLGRPTTYKTIDFSPACQSKDFSILLACNYSSQKTLETQVYESLLHLMDLVGPLCDTPDLRMAVKSTDAYLKTAALDRDLNSWYSKLPNNLKWTADNVSHMPPSFPLLHSQYHAILILLHRPFVQYVNYGLDRNPSEAEKERVNHFAVMSRSVCIDNAKRITSIFQKYRETFDTTRMFQSGLGHVGTAATALIAEVISKPNSKECVDLLENLQSLNQTMALLSRTYPTAVAMTKVVNHFIKNFRQRTEPQESNGDLDMIDPSLHETPSQLPPYPAKPGQPVQNMESSNFTLMNKGGRFEGTMGADHCFQGLPMLPSSWFEEMDWRDMEFLNLIGLKDLQNVSAMGWLDGLNFQSPC